MLIRRLLVVLATLALAACTTSSTASPSPSATSSDTAADASASPAPEASPSDDGKAQISSSSESPSPPAAPFVTPVPKLDAAPNIPIGKVLSAMADHPAPGMVRLSGTVVRGKAAAPYVCVTLGPPIACAVLTDAGGRYEIDVPQGRISWEFHFIHGGTEVGPRVVIDGPFGGDVVAVETVSVSY